MVRSKQILGSVPFVSFCVEAPTGIRVSGIWKLSWLNTREAILFSPRMCLRSSRSQLLVTCREYYILGQVFVFLINTHKQTPTHKGVECWIFRESSLAGGNEPLWQISIYCVISPAKAQMLTWGIICGWECDHFSKSASGLSSLRSPPKNKFSGWLRTYRYLLQVKQTYGDH